MHGALDRLLEELEASHHVGRVRRMLALGRDAKVDAGALALVDTLGAGDAYQRRLAVHALATLGDGGRLLRFVEDASASIRSLAFTLVPALCDDAQALEALKMAYGLRREKVLVQGLSRRRRRPVIDRFLDWLVVQPGFHDIVDLVPYATSEGVRRHLGRALARPSAIFWDRLARGCPKALAEIFCERLRALEAPALDERGQPVAREPDPVTRQLIERHTAAIAEEAPDEALVLLDLLIERGIRSQLGRVVRLGALRPAGTLALVERWDLRVGGSPFASSAAELDEAALRRIVRRDPTLLGAAMSLAKTLPAAKLAAVADAWCETVRDRPTWGICLIDRIADPARRMAAYQVWSVAARDRDGAIGLHVVQELPPDLREREGRRHLGEVIALGTRPLQRLPYVRFLPWDDADAALRAYLGSPEAGLRGLALTTLLAIPGLRPAEPELVDRALALVLARKNEQDPVRLVMLEALAAWPRTIWRKEHVPKISQIVRDALDAGDLSHASGRAAERLVLRTFGLDPARGAEWLGTLLRERGELYDVRVGAHLGDEEVRAAAPHLLAIARSWGQRERVFQVIQLAESLGARLPLVEGLAEVLTTTLRETPSGGVAAMILGLFAAHDRPRFEAMVAGELRRWLDRGWVGEVLGFASRREGKGKRQPPLHPELGAMVESIARGRGSDAQVIQAVTLLRVRDVVRFDRILGELLAADASYVSIPVILWHIHERRQDLLGPYLRAEAIRGRFATGKTAWVLPFERGFHRWTPAQNRAFAAILARVIGDSERDTPTVWRCLAVHAALDAVTMEGLAAAAEDPRAAVQERAIRVMSRCDEGQCVPTLLRCLEDARARVAIYSLRRALRGMPPTRALTILAGVSMRKVTVGKEVVRLLGELRSDAAYARLIELDGQDLHRDVRIAMLRALWDHLDREPTWGVFERAVTGADWVMAARVGDIPADRLTVTSDRRLSALLARVLLRPEPEARIELLQRAWALAIRDPERAFLGAIGGRLRSLFDDEVRAAMVAILQRSTEVDIERLPGLLGGLLDDPRSLHTAVSTLLGISVRTRALWTAAARRVERVLADDPRHAVMRVRCAAAAMEARELAEYLAGLAEAGAIDANVLAACEAIVQGLRLEDVARFAARLERSPSAAARRIALWALVRDAGPGRGWQDERLAGLARFQADPSPLVSGPALAVFPPREMVK